MKTKLLAFGSGLVVGLIVMACVVWVMMPKLMVTVHESKYDVDRTVEEIKSSMAKSDWKVPKVYDMQKSLNKHVNVGDMTKMKIISLCQPAYAYRILREDKNKMVSAIMPCRMSVYESTSGKTYIAGMNVRLMSKMFGGTIEEVMADVATEEELMLSGVIK